jgi:membrane associated rhomboid family serine protease
MNSNLSPIPAIAVIIGFLALASLSLVLGEQFQEYWLASIMLVIGGVFLLVIFNKKMPAAGPSVPKIKA